MIGRLKGIIVEKLPPSLVLDVHGVGYDVEAPMSTFYKLPETGEQTILLTHLIVREDAFHLYGFATENERRFFRSLLKVNGVGAKLALTILSGIEAEEFVACVNGGDTARLIRLPGVGKKTAERLVLEMRDRLSEWHKTSSISSLPSSNAKYIPITTTLDDAISALISLGYKPQDADKMIRKIAEDGMTSEQLIRKALQSAG